MTVEHAGGFYLPWSAALAASAAVPKSPTLVFHVAGVDLPVVQLVLAIAGVLLARPLARKREAALPFIQFAIVTLVMLVIAIVWVSEARPGLLFTFVVAIGLGFSGYSLIEAAGEQMQELIKRMIDRVADALNFGGKEK